MIATLFKPFVMDPKSVPVPYQKLDPVRPAVDKDIHIPRVRPAVQFSADDPAQPLKTLPHIRNTPIQVKPKSG
jgi:hypothetical protein